MLQLYFGDRYTKVLYDLIDTNFRTVCQKGWLTTDFARRVISEIDHSEVLGDFVVNNSRLGVISHDWLSGGAKTLITAYFLPDEVFPMRNLSDNCSPFLREIADARDTKWFVYEYVPEGLDNLDIKFMDWNEKIVNESDFKKWFILNRPETDELHSTKYSQEWVSS